MSDIILKCSQIVTKTNALSNEPQLMYNQQKKKTKLLTFGTRQAASAIKIITYYNNK